MKVFEIKNAVPTAVTSLRLAAAPAFVLAFEESSWALPLALFGLAALTDALDGFLARKLDAASGVGAYVDVTADFAFIGSAFWAFCRNGWYGALELGVIASSFALFIASSTRKRPVYDPVGKYMGAFLMAMIAVSILLPYRLVRHCLTLLLCSFFSLSVLSRISFLRGLGTTRPAPPAAI